MTNCRPLFKFYTHQAFPQQAYLIITANKEIYTEIDDCSGTPSNFFNEIDLRFRISNNFTDLEIEKLIVKYKEELEFLIDNTEIRDGKRIFSSRIRDDYYDLIQYLDLEVTDDFDCCDFDDCEYCNNERY